MPDIGGTVGAVASIAGGLLSGSASKDAANTQAKSAKEATAEQARQFDITRADQMPFLNMGKEALYTLADFMGLNVPSDMPSVNDAQARYEAAKADYDRLTTKYDVDARFPTMSGQKTSTNYVVSPGNKTVSGKKRKRVDAAFQNMMTAWDSLQQAKTNLREPSENTGFLLDRFGLDDFEKEPGYEFRLGEGEKAINRAFSKRYDSGSTLKALTRFGQDYASNEYGKAYDRDAADKARIYNFLAGISGTGQAAANTLGAHGADYARSAGENIVGAGNARAAGIVGSANALNQGFQNAYNIYNQNRMMDRIFAQPQNIVAPAPPPNPNTWGNYYPIPVSRPGSAIPGYYG